MRRIGPIGLIGLIGRIGLIGQISLIRVIGICPAGFGANSYSIALKNKSPETLEVWRDLYVLCRIMLRQQFDTMLKCFIIKKKSVLFVWSIIFIEVVVLTHKKTKSLIVFLDLTHINIKPLYNNHSDTTPHAKAQRR